MAIKDQMGGGAGGGNGQQPPRRQAPQGGEGGGGDGDEEPPEGYDAKRLYNENRKLQRLLAKANGEFSDFRSKVEPQLSRLQKLGDVFGNPGGKVEESESGPSIFEQIYDLDSQSRARDPENGGMPITVGLAKKLEEATSIIKQQADELKKLRGEADTFKKPAHTAENMLYVSLDGLLHENLLELFEGDEEAADLNKPDFERVAGELLKQKRQNFGTWRQLLTNPKKQAEFVQEVLAKKIPSRFKGAQPIEYSMDDAMADMKRAESMKPGPERAALRKKARMRFLEGTVGDALAGGG